MVAGSPFVARVCNAVNTKHNHYNVYKLVRKTRQTQLHSLTAGLAASVVEGGAPRL